MATRTPHAPARNTRGPEVRIRLSVWEQQTLQTMMAQDGERHPHNFLHRLILLEASRRALVRIPKPTEPPLPGVSVVASSAK